MVVAFPGSVTSDWAKTLVGKMITLREDSRGDGRSISTPVQFSSVRIAGAKLVDDGRTMLLATDPHSRAGRYEFPLNPGQTGPATAAYDLSGVEAVWTEAKQDEGAEPAWKGWWPALDVQTTRLLTVGSIPHERGLSLLQKPGRLVLNALVTLPTGDVTVRIESSGKISDAMLGDEPFPDSDRRDATAPHRCQLMVHSRGEPMFLTLTIATEATIGPPLLRGSYGIGRDSTFQPIAREQLSLPWAPAPALPSVTATTTAIPDLAGGDTERGRVVFFGDQARCGQCHAYKGQGGTIGPDLSDVGRKGNNALYQSIAAPSLEIAPEYVPYTVAARDGRVLAGVVRAEGADAIRITDTTAKVTTLRRDEIEQIRPSATSIMPVGLAGAVGEAAVRDLIAFLTRSAISASQGARPAP